MTNPFDMFSKSLNMWTKAAMTAQESWIQMATSQAEQLQGQAKSTSDIFPMPPMGMMMDEAKIREAFQSAADKNLNSWTQMAEKIAALPSWVRWPTEVPGRAMTDMFDMLRPFPVFYSSPTPQKTIEAMPAIKEQADDLTVIKGIGPKISEKLEALGITCFAQIATWSDTEALQADIALSLGGRIERQHWVAQAKRLAKPVLH